MVSSDLVLLAEETGLSDGHTRDVFQLLQDIHPIHPAQHQVVHIELLLLRRESLQGITRSQRVTGCRRMVLLQRALYQGPPLLAHRRHPLVRMLGTEE